ncbi:YrhK family protein [Roseovarius aestuariivivens]|uniref:YrhK family protein n=1 Tax=Roseovarius aestuariivivens TaxID=1888910 RepID=UPI00107FE1E9|nr:YrhK family protein [Roseovarius aestuariivivens]
MTLFSSQNRDRNDETRRLYALFELVHTAVDFLAALSFLIGSILFLWPDHETPAIWLFVIGSVFFCLKPTIRMIRELKLASMGDTEDLAKRYDR